MVNLKEHKKEVFFFSIAVVVVLLDQLTKYLFLKFNYIFNLNYLTLHLIKNTGAGFGLLKGQTWLLTIISTIVVILVILLFPRIPPEKKPLFFTALFLGGTLGNLIDRLLRKFVVDFIDFSFWPAFNIADACITVGVIGLVYYMLLK
ncbi:signal peptidase II [Nanoarchaeota archaeon]